jgi:hypothetical protein
VGSGIGVGIVDGLDERALAVGGHRRVRCRHRDGRRRQRQRQTHCTTDYERDPFIHFAPPLFVLKSNLIFELDFFVPKMSVGRFAF